MRLLFGEVAVAEYDVSAVFYLPSLKVNVSHLPWVIMSRGDATTPEP